MAMSTGMSWPITEVAQRLIGWHAAKVGLRPVADISGLAPQGENVWRFSCASGVYRGRQCAEVFSQSVWH